MPRRSRPRRSSTGPPARPLGSGEVREQWPDGEWVVRRVSGAGAERAYRCPGCSQLVPPGTPHVVAWPVAGGRLSGVLFGDGDDVRRHWHSACWRARDRRRP